MANRKSRRAHAAMVTHYLTADDDASDLVDLAAVGLRGNPGLNGAPFEERKAVVRDLIARDEACFVAVDPPGTIGVDLICPRLRLPLLDEDFAVALERVRTKTLRRST
ncbi:MAG: hypothetical protein JSR99_09965 [Proteobacteria bacterium]|nr:hypothetical protein [Pseudomonadota bacterium]